MLDTIVNTLSAYPRWITFLIFVCFSLSIGMLTFFIRKQLVKKRVSSAQKDVKSKFKAFMKIKHVQLIPDDAEAEINVVVSVNGIEFLQPSETDAGWMAAGPILSEKIISLPNAEMYYIRFEMNFSSGKKFEGGPALVRSDLMKKDTKKAAGQTMATYPTIPLVADYKLYFLQDGSRDTSVKAVISYEIYVE